MALRTIVRSGDQVRFGALVVPIDLAEQRLVLSGIDWTKYGVLLRQLEGRHLRFTFADGNLEVMTVSPEHEQAKKLLARLLEALTEEMDLPILSLGNTTFRREDRSRGLEPDECWYIQHEAEMRGKTEIDLAHMPPPDLVLEVGVSRSIMDRMEIYARLGVPEVWRFDGHELRVCRLCRDASYVEVDRSPTFPNVPLEGFRETLVRRGQADETSLVRAFRVWVRGLTLDR